MSKPKLPGVRAWAWEMEGGLCYWAQPTKHSLLKEGKPSDEARPRLVRIMKESDLRMLVKRIAAVADGKASGKPEHRGTRARRY